MNVEQPRRPSSDDASPAAAAAVASPMYDAFISYRHVEPDRSWSRWLLTKLESYRVPSTLRKLGIAGRKLRVFRDEDELSAVSDLSDAIKEALRASRFLVVVCSPRTPESRWVNAEVEYFAELGRHRQVLALLIDGEPYESFPRALGSINRALIVEDEAANKGREFEPLAADVRTVESGGSQGKRKHAAALRILARCLGVPFDALRQRDVERRRRRLQLVATGVAAILLAFCAVLYYAHLKRRDAEGARSEVGTARSELQKVAAEAKTETRRAGIEVDSIARAKRLRDYTEDIRDVKRAWDANDLGRARLLLDRNAPSAGALDLRGLEWFYWDLRLREAYVSFKGMSGARSIDVSADGKLVACCNLVEAVVWDVPAGAEKFRGRIRSGGPRRDPPGVDSGAVHAVAISPDSSLLAATTFEEVATDRRGFLCAWDLSTGAEKLSVDGDAMISGESVAFDPTGAHVLVGAYDGAWKAWRLADGTPSFSSDDEAAGTVTTLAPKPLQAPERDRARSSVVAVRCDEDGHSVETVAHRNVFHSGWPAANKRVRRNKRDRGAGNPVGDETRIVGVTLEGFQLAATTALPGMEPVPKRVRFGEPPGVEFTSLDVLGDGFIVGGTDRVVRQYPLPMRADHRVAPAAEFRGCTGVIAAVALGRTHVAACTRQGTVFVWSRKPAHVFRLTEVAVPAPAVVDAYRSPSGRLGLRWDSSKQEVAVLDGEGAILGVIPGRRRQPVLSFSPGERFVVVRDPSGRGPEVREKSLVIWSKALSRVTVEAACSRADVVVPVAFSPDEALFAAALSRKEVVFIDPLSGEQRARVEAAQVNAIRFDASGRRAALGLDSRLAVWDLDQASWLLQGDRPARFFTFDPTGGTVVFRPASDDDPRALMSVSLPDGNPERIIGGASLLGSISLSRDGTRFYAMNAGVLQVSLSDLADLDPLVSIPGVEGAPEDAVMMGAAVDALLDRWRAAAASRSESPSIDSGR